MEITRRPTNVNQPSRPQFRRVNRFVRPGVDIVMEKKMLDSASVSTSSSGHKRTTYFLASRVLKEPVSAPKSPVTGRKCNKLISCFISSGIEKGEGYPGGGQVTSFRKIGFNPLKEFKELRIKRQHKLKENKVENPSKKPPPLVPKSSAELLRTKRQCEEVAAAMRETEQQKVKRKQELADQRKREYEEIMSYNPWGQPAVGAPKLTRSGKIRAQLQVGLTRRDSGEDKYDLFGMPRKYPQYPGHGNSMEGFYRRRQLDSRLVSEFEKSRSEKEMERRKYYKQCLENQIQRTKENQNLESKEKWVPTDFLWGRTEVARDLSGKLIPRRRQLYLLDPGEPFNKGYQTYFNIGDTAYRIPGHYPFRGEVDYSYNQWGKPGANSLMRSKASGHTPLESTLMGSIPLEIESTPPQPIPMASVTPPQLQDAPSDGSRKESQAHTSTRSSLEQLTVRNTLAAKHGRRLSLPGDTRLLAPPEGTRGHVARNTDRRAATLPEVTSAPETLPEAGKIAVALPEIKSSLSDGQACCHGNPADTRKDSTHFPAVRDKKIDFTENHLGHIIIE